MHIIPSLQVFLLLGSCIKYCVWWFLLACVSNVLITSRVTGSPGCLGTPLVTEAMTEYLEIFMLCFFDLEEIELVQNMLYMHALSMKENEVQICFS